MREGLRFNSTASSESQVILNALQRSNRRNPEKKLDTSSLYIINESSQRNPQVSKSEEIREFVSKQEVKINPKDVAAQLRITGPRAGKIVKVINHDIDGAFRALRSVVNSNNIKGDQIDQRFYLKPGKARELKTIRKNKREFMKGFKRLMEVVKDASRRGY